MGEQRKLIDANGKPRYRLLACDLDGTLVGEDMAISPRVRRALAAAQARGVHVTLATGRGFTAALPFAQQLGIIEPLICYHGGVIRHPVTTLLLHRTTMNRELLLRVITLAEERDWHLVMYLDDVMFIREYRHDTRFYREMLGRDMRLVNDLADALMANGAQPDKFLVVASESQCDDIYRELDHRFGREMHVVRSHLLFVEGNPPGADKGQGLRRLAEHLGVSQSEVMAIGDQGNDVPMLEWAGLGVAMGSGSVAAKAAADWIAPPLAQDGVAAAIERFLLN